MIDPKVVEALVIARSRAKRSPLHEQAERQRPRQQATAMAMVVPDRSDRVLIARRPRCDRQRPLTCAVYA